MSRRAVDAVFQALFSLTDIRVILRRTAPLHDLAPDEGEEVRKHLAELREQIRILEEDLLP